MFWKRTTSYMFVHLVPSNIVINMMCQHAHTHDTCTYPLVSFLSSNSTAEGFVHHVLNVIWVAKVSQMVRKIQQLVRSLLEEQSIHIILVNFS